MTIKSKYRKFVGTAFVLLPMTLIMAFVVIMRNDGLKDGWELKYLKTWLTMFPIAYAAGLLIIPLANRLLQQINFSDKIESGLPATNQAPIEIQDSNPSYHSVY